MSGSPRPAERVTLDPRRLLLALAVTLLVVATWWTRAYTDFTPARFKVVEQIIRPTAGRVSVSTRDFPGVAALPRGVAIIARIRTSGETPEPLTIAIDGVPVCTTAIGGDDTHRIDCASYADWSRQTDHEAALTRSGDWTLEYLELATHHGNSFGFNTFFVTPADASHHRPPGAARTLALAIAVFLFWQVPATCPRSRTWRRLIAAFGGLVSVLALVILAAPVISPYLVLLSTGTFMRWLALALAPRLWTAGRWLLLTEGRALSYARTAIVAVVVAFVMSIPVRWWLNGPYHHNYSGFLSIPKAHFDANPLLNARDDIRDSLILLEHGGYDGQFMYFAAFDPFLRAFKDQPEIYGRIFDQAPYRYGRVGFPLLARLLSFGSWQRLPATLIWIVVGGLFCLAATVAWTAEARGMNAAIAGLVLCVPGFWFSVQAGLPEPVAGALLVGALVFLAHDRLTWAALLFAASLLVRETGMIAVGAAAIALWYTGRRRDALRLCALAVTPLLLWRIYSGWILYPDWGTRAFLFSTPSGRPMSGIFTMWSLIVRGEYRPEFPSFAIAGISFPLLLIAALVLFALMLRAAPSVAALAGLIYAASALTLRYDMVWLHVGNAERTTYEVFLMLLLGVLDVRRYPGWLRTALVIFWVAAGVYVVWGGYDSPHIRETLWPAQLS